MVNDVQLKMRFFLISRKIIKDVRTLLWKMLFVLIFVLAISLYLVPLER